MKTLSIFEEGYEKGKAEAEKIHLEFVEKLKESFEHTKKIVGTNVIRDQQLLNDFKEIFYEETHLLNSQMKGINTQNSNVRKVSDTQTQKVAGK